MKKLRGGKRPGSGPIQKYGESTIILSFWIPKSKKPEIHKLVRTFLDNLYKETIKSKKGDDYGC